MCAPIPTAWLPYVLGALSQLRQPSAWVVADEADVAAIMGWVDLFIGNVAVASMCDERGTVSVTITAGNASGTATVTFPYDFGTTPVVVCSADNGSLIASPAAISSSGFTATLTAGVPVLADTTATLLWIAGPAT